MHKYIKDNYPCGLDEEMAIGYLRQLMNGFMEIQKFNVMHRDLKPNNLFLKNNNLLVIGDFGFAKHSKDFGKTKLGMNLFKLRHDSDHGSNYYQSQN